MSEDQGQDVTQLLIRMAEGNQGAVDRLLPVVYRELRRLAGGFLRREVPMARRATKADEKPERALPDP